MPVGAPTAGRRGVADVLLRRLGVVYLPDAASGPSTGVGPGVELLETDLLDRGWLLSGPLRAGLSSLGPADLRDVGADILTACDALLGADSPHVPLFRNFPDGTPADTFAFYCERVLSLYFQQPMLPCVLCGRDGSVAPVNPCGHLVCSACFDGSDFSACPICHRRIALDDPFLRPSRDRPPATDRAFLPNRWRVLRLGADRGADAAAELAGLLARTGALTPDDDLDLVALLDGMPRDDLARLPTEVRGREPKARLIAWLLEGPADDGGFERAAALVDTATDVLRVLAVRSGGSATLVDRPPMASVSRPLRRSLLRLLERRGPVALVDDMRRHRRAWIAAGEKLHPGEHAARFPAVATAFAVLRGTDLHRRPRELAAAAATSGVDVVEGRAVVVPWARAVEESLARGDVVAAVAAVRDRPGELVRRLDHLLRLAHDPGEVDAVLDALVAGLPRVAPAVVLSALGALRTRAVARRARVFHPAGTSAPHIVADHRPPLPAAVVARVAAALTGEMLRRAAALPRAPRAVLDAGLDHLTLPFGERTMARALVTLGRGSTVPVPEGRHLRLFCHWTENAGGPRVDLDLSASFHAADWAHVGKCDYTSLTFPGAVHSGDLTSAPPPLGASEFIDLDLDLLGESGVRYVVAAVLSFNNVPFTDMAEAFAGFMLRADRPDVGPVFDPRSVEQRFDLTGPGKVTVPFVVDIAERTMRWLDVSARVSGDDHSLFRHSNAMVVLVSALEEGFRAGSRVTLGELGRWHAAGRADEVLLRDGARVTRFARRAGEDTAGFAARLAGGSDGDGSESQPAAADLLMLVRGDRPATPGATAYALYPNDLDHSVVRLVSAADLAAQLGPLARST